MVVLERPGALNDQDVSQADSFGSGGCWEPAAIARPANEGTLSAGSLIRAARYAATARMCAGAVGFVASDSIARARSAIIGAVAASRRPIATAVASSRQRASCS